MSAAAGGREFPGIRVSAVVLSLLVSVWFFYNAGLINNDGIHYVSAAGLIGAGDWAGACNLEVLGCWLLFPALIAGVDALTGLGAEGSAFLLEALFSALMVFVYLTLIRELGGTRVTMLVAVFVILLHPFLSSARGEIIRDHGYWALYLLMVLCFIRYWQGGAWRYAMAWAVTAAAATLFRIEGSVFLVFLPPVLLLDTSKQWTERLARLLKAYAVTGLIVLLLLAWWLLDPSFSASDGGRLFEPLQRLDVVREELHTGLENRAQILGEQVLGNELDNYALSALWAGLLTILAYKVINTLSPLYTALFLFRRLRVRFVPPPGVLAIMVWLVILNLLILLVELLTKYTLSGRFIVPLALTLMLVVPFLLEALYTHWRAGVLQGWRQWLVLPVVGAALLFMTVDGFYSSGGDRHGYLRDAGHWLKARREPADRLFSNNARVIYYGGSSGESGHWVSDRKALRILKRGKWRQYDYVAIQVDEDDARLRNKALEALGVPTAEFSNDRRDTVLIFSTSARSP